MKQCLLVGGAGFIGEAVVRALHAQGGRKLVVVGRSEIAPRALPAGVDYLSCSHDSGNAVLTRVLPDCDEVIDLAYTTVPQTSFEDPVHDVLSNLPFSVDLLRLASENTLRRFVFVSSGGTVYGNPLYLPIDENHPTNPVSPYGITKLALEKYGRMYHQSTGLPFVVVRPGNAYGPGQLSNRGQGFVATAIDCALNGYPLKVFGPRGTVRDYIYVDDLAQAIVAILEHGESGCIYNAGSGQGLDNLALLDKLRPLVEADGFRLCFRHHPTRSFDVLTNVLSAARLTQDTGWSPRTEFDEGLRVAWAWAKSAAKS